MCFVMARENLNITAFTTFRHPWTHVYVIRKSTSNLSVFRVQRAPRVSSSQIQLLFKRSALVKCEPTSRTLSSYRMLSRDPRWLVNWGHGILVPLLQLSRSNMHHHRPTPWGHSAVDLKDSYKIDCGVLLTLYS